MDPNATLRLISENLIPGDVPPESQDEDAIEAACNLHVWLAGKGFAPNWKRYPEATAFYCAFFGVEVRQ